MLLQELLQGGGAEAVLVGDHLDDARQVGAEVALVPVGQDGGHGGVVKLNVLVVDLDKVDGGVALDDGQQG